MVSITYKYPHFSILIQATCKKMNMFIYLQMYKAMSLIIDILCYQTGMQMYLTLFIISYSCAPAAEMLQSNGDVKRKWSWAVEWLNDELERRPYPGNAQYTYNNWSPPAQSNETSNGQAQVSVFELGPITRKSSYIFNSSTLKLFFLILIISEVF